MCHFPAYETRNARIRRVRIGADVSYRDAIRIARAVRQNHPGAVVEWQAGHSLPKRPDLEPWTAADAQDRALAAQDDNLIRDIVFRDVSTIIGPHTTKITAHDIAIAEEVHRLKNLSGPATI